MGLRLERTRQFEQWLNKLRNRVAKQRIVVTLDRIRYHGKVLGDVKPVGGGVIEMRFDRGPGYRVYFSMRSNEVLLLLIGGGKSSQGRDIEKAQALLREWMDGHGR